MEPYFAENGIILYHGDCRVLLSEDPSLAAADVVVTDPPYGQTSLRWDRWVTGWPSLLTEASSLWVFGSLRMFTAHWQEFESWKLSQDLIWQKHNGSSFHADRFRRIHEQICHFYRGEWRDIYKHPVTTPDAVAKTIRRKRRPTHMGHIEAGSYESHDGGPRLQRSVIEVRSEHGHAVHPTQKPLGILAPLIEYSCPPGGIVFDPFCGAGSTLVAAATTGRFAIGIEADESYCEKAVARIRDSFIVVGS